MHYFLLVYDRLEGVLREVKEFRPTERDAALAERFEREFENRDSPELEIIVLGAKSRTALQQTHARYFQSVGEMIQTASEFGGRSETGADEPS